MGLIIDDELFESLKNMARSKNEEDVTMAISIMETCDKENKQNLEYIEQVYETMRDSHSRDILNRLKMRVWMSVNGCYCMTSINFLNLIISKK